MSGLAGRIECRDNGIEVTRADDSALVSLTLVAHRDPRALDVQGDLMIFGTGPTAVTYKVTGWDAESMALVVEKVS